MRQMIKKYLFYAVLIGIVYFMLAYHYIYIGGKQVRLLKKETLNLKYTFYSIVNKQPQTIMKIDVLREAGIGDILVDAGVISEAQKEQLIYQQEYE